MAAANPPAGPSPLHYPVHVHADPQPAATSRWLWLVKWLLAIPHYVVLAFLWVAFMVLSVVAFVAILVTGRYPRAHLRLQRRRAALVLAGRLLLLRGAGHGPVPAVHAWTRPDYPAHFDVDYPEHLSRGLVLVKWWLLAIPQYIVVGVFLGGGHVGGRAANGQWQQVWGGGLIGILVLVAAVLLAFTGSYPGGVRPAAGREPLGAAGGGLRGLMTDEYPPFRLDMGGEDPAAALLLPGSPPQPPVTDTAPSPS